MPLYKRYTSMGTSKKTKIEKDKEETQWVVDSRPLIIESVFEQKVPREICLFGWSLRHAK